MSKRVACHLVACILVLPVGLLAEEPTRQGSHFPDLEPESASVRAFNLRYTEWLLSGQDAVARGLAGCAASPVTNAERIETLLSALRQDATMLSNRDGPFTAITKWAITADREVQRMRSRLNSEADPSVMAESRVNLGFMERELAIVGPAADKPSEYAERIEQLIERIGEWLRLWESTERVTGVDAARRQVQPLMAAEAERWRGYARLELATAMRMRNYKIPGETPPALRARFQDVLRRLPILSRAPSVQPPLIHPLAGDSPSALGIEFETTVPADVRLSMRVNGARPVDLNVESAGRGTYKAAWQPYFLSNMRWQRRLRKRPELALGEWRLDWQIATTNLVSGDRFVTQTGTVHVAVTAAAPKGSVLDVAPRKPRILKRYSSESDIPLGNRYDVWSYISYPILGFPRDLLDSVFGVVDKVPYVSIPINFVYAAPGQLICKPWWDDEYTPFSEQSAGFLSWDEWKTGGEWEYFENARTWYWPDNAFGCLIMGILYVPLGLPRDLLDMPFGWLDQIPYVSMPVSYVYEPVTLVTKPWYAQRYTTGDEEGRQRIPYAEQSKNVVDGAQWWEHSRWVFFENYKTTTFRRPNHEGQARRRAKYREASAAYERAMAEWQQKNAEIAETFVIRLQTGPDRWSE
jgi:hypothetical protein